MSSDVAIARVLAQERARRQQLVRRTLRNPLSLAGLIIIGLLLVIAVIAPVVAPSNPLQTNISRRLEAPSRDYLLGTDQLGRDVFSRILYGARISLRLAALEGKIATVL